MWIFPNLDHRLIVCCHIVQASALIICCANGIFANMIRCYYNMVLSFIVVIVGQWETLKITYGSHHKNRKGFPSLINPCTLILTIWKLKTKNKTFASSIRTHLHIIVVTWHVHYSARLVFSLPHKPMFSSLYILAPIFLLIVVWSSKPFSTCCTNNFSALERSSFKKIFLHFFYFLEPRKFCYYWKRYGGIYARECMILSLYNTHTHIYIFHM